MTEDSMKLIAEANLLLKEWTDEEKEAALKEAQSRLPKTDCAHEMVNTDYYTGFRDTRCKICDVRVRDSVISHSDGTYEYIRIS